MPARFTFSRVSAIIGVFAVLSLSACETNQYGPPMEGQPVSWGQQHYLNNKLAQERHLDGRSDSAGAGAQAGGADH